MPLTPQQLVQFAEEGYLFLPKAVTRCGATSYRRSEASLRAHCRSASRRRWSCGEPFAAGELVRWCDVRITESDTVRARRDMERRFAPVPAAIAAQ
jgi:hypothetical protein